MIPAELNINLYKASSHVVVFAFVNPDGTPYTITGDLTLEVFRRFEVDPFLDVALSPAGDLYRCELDTTQTDITATTYPFHLKLTDGADVDHIVSGVVSVSDVFTSTTTEVGDTITIDSVTNEVSVSDADVAAVTAIAAKDDAVTAKDLAERWASEAEDVEVEAGEYSAKHYSAKAEESYLQIEGAELPMGITASIPSGATLTVEQGIITGYTE